ncbi:MAG TPA: hypothetical protein VHL08_06195 [Dongiaceae bacterium]|jgi:hypothetical protein|nr:hypothetical protein [Dongiaceae bacterium]
MMMLKRYWFQFEALPRPTALNLGCGVTAFDYDDAIYLLCERVFGQNGPPPIIKCIENIDFSALEKGHVLPNIGQPDARGIWFPQGY